MADLLAFLKSCLCVLSIFSNNNAPDIVQDPAAIDGMPIYPVTIPPETCPVWEDPHYKANNIKPPNDYLFLSNDGSVLTNSNDMKASELQYENINNNLVAPSNSLPGPSPPEKFLPFLNKVRNPFDSMNVKEEALSPPEAVSFNEDKPENMLFPVSDIISKENSSPITNDNENNGPLNMFLKIKWVKKIRFNDPPPSKQDFSADDGNNIDFLPDLKSAENLQNINDRPDARNDFFNPDFMGNANFQDSMINKPSLEDQHPNLRIVSIRKTLFPLMDTRPIGLDFGSQPYREFIKNMIRGKDQSSLGDTIFDSSADRD